MSSMTKEQGREFKERWRLVNRVIAEEIRTTPFHIKLQQLQTMFIRTSDSHRSAKSVREDEEVRRRWLVLKDRLNAPS